MKRSPSRFPLILPVVAVLLQGFAACAATFTSDTTIRFNNTNYDGMDIVVTNCTLTVDGPHAFASLQVLNGGNLTYTFAPNGYVDNWLTVSHEPQVLSATNVATLANTNVGHSTLVVQDYAGAVTYSNGVDYVAGTDASGMTTLLLTTNSAIAEGSTNLVRYEYFVVVLAEVNLTVTGDVAVAQGGMINTDGKGYEGGAGPGRGNSSGSPMSGSGAGHGGFGGQSEAVGGAGGGVSYGSIQQPVLLGSGGGSGYGGLGGSGGGRIKLVGGGTLRVDGLVTANGVNATNECAGGGSGGSIWLSAGSIAGTGTLSANGGAGEPARGGGGGGGRISLQYDSSLFAGTTYARGGNGYVRGGAGTIYTRANSQSVGQVLVDNGGRSGARTSFFPGEAFDLTAQGGALIVVEGSRSFGNLVLKSNAWLSLVNQMVTVTGDATIQAGGGITADGAGYAGGQGTGAGKPYSSAFGYTGGGGGYGGYGAAGGATNSYGGTAYGPVPTPMDLGSGGGTAAPYAIGGAGGGSVRLTVTGMLLLDGRISSDGSMGLTPGGGGGSGGSIWLTVGTLAGAGTISANGGMGNGVGIGGGGGAGGGRIAIQYTANLFFGVTSARGGSGAGYGGAGTIYTRANNQSWSHVLADNGGQAGTNTTLGSTSPGTVDLTVKGGAVVTPQSSQTFSTLVVASNGWLRVANQILNVTGNATVQAGGGIIADGTGNGAGSGTGAGRYSYSTAGYIGGGGGYGGCGASGLPGTGTPGPIGGTAYGDTANPNDLGSGGGYFYSPGMGGAGGGAVRLTVAGVLLVDGRISAGGAAAVSASGGGGSGGTINLNVGTLAGSGTIAANGGMGLFQGGGGGGGRIAIRYGLSEFSGLVSAYGGSGYAAGGAGTIYTKANNQQYGLIVADNGGQAGTNTSCSSAGTIDLVVRGGAVVSPPSTMLSSLLVASNSWILMTNSSQQVTVSGNATIQAGGGIIADGAGYAGGSGTGAGYYRSAGSYGYIGGGAGYGGYGGSGNALPDYPAPSGGNTYGNINAPMDLGSGGGGYSPYAVGGTGGGAIRLTVTGVLQVDGRISARGSAGNNPSAGGGSGGSIYLTVGTLAGSGVISANGGAGNARGGGGGGGRIAVVFTSSSSANGFTGLMSAYGGSGYIAGGAGTIYLRPYSTAQGPTVVVLDNGGQAGTNSGWSTGVTADLILRNGASLGMPFSSQTILGNLLISSNGWIYIKGSAGLNGPPLNVLGNATIQAGGGIVADGGGYAYNNGGSGPGAGGYMYGSYVGGGGGFGGCGGNSGGSPAAAGGRSVGSVSAGGPGSAGGTYTTTPVGSAGGGAVSLYVTGALLVDGRISSAGGVGGTSNAGGGAGGGIVITTGTLAGSGVIAANGGAGNGLGGGGGGGRIVVIANTANAFGGVMSAYGGAGYVRGGAGTIYTVNRGTGFVLADNGGQVGTNTSLTTGSTMNLTVTGGAIVALQFPLMTLANLMVTSNAWVIVSNQMLTVTSNATVQAGGGIIADGMGYGGNAGPGAGKFTSGSPTGNVGGGGGYGGYGASGGSNTLAYGGSPYRTMTARAELGSGGGSSSAANLPPGAGGGAVQLNVIGALLVNGRISANGGNAIGQGAGGGSGGGVWITAGTLAGAGIISANGGAGNGLGGGGGGGRVALEYGVNAFEGAVSACGGGGYAWGGAGTIYTKANSQAMGQVLVDNCGHWGTNTPVGDLTLFDLVVRGGAVAYPSSPPLLLSNLVINSGGVFTCGQGQTNLEVEVLRNTTIDAGGVMAVDGKGFAAGVGPGAGLSSQSIGSGAGYGGVGGASSVSPGGGTYGSQQQPVDWGSGGGLGYGPATAGSEGGGAIRLTVGGVLMVHGRLSAGGNAGMQDDAGGGSGGSVWLSAAALAGTGTIAADGGAGELFEGGGGGGGRVAIYTPLNVFSGLVSAAGREGLFPGQVGSTFYAVTPPAPQIVSISPGGTITSAVSSAEVVFDSPVDPYSVGPPGVSLIAPGSVIVDGLASVALSPYHYRIDFPTQTAQGDYQLTFGPQVKDLYGQPLAHVYLGIFSIAWTTVQGSITNTNGEPVSDVLVQFDGGGAAATTDTNGNYVLAVPPGGAVIVTPSKSGIVLVPSSRTYWDVTTAVTNENYLAVTSVTPTLASQVETNNLILNWYGIPGVSYQLYYSIDLVGWLPYDNPLVGTNGPLQVLVPVDAEPFKFFRLQALY